MRMITAPEPIKLLHHEEQLVFLAGSIEMGIAEDWQSVLADSVKDVDNLVLLNPRRKAWDSTWKQDIKNPQFVEQVTWEQEGIEMADYVIFYFDPLTKSPITLMELGLWVGLDESDGIVCCPEGYWRKGNVDILCIRNERRIVESLHDIVDYLSNLI